MELSKSLGARLLLATALSAGGIAHAATEQISNGGFSSVSGSGLAGGIACLLGNCDTAASWSDNSISFSNGVANFNGSDDWLSQTFTTLFAAGTTFAGSFFYDKTNTSNANNPTLTYSLQTSATQDFLGPVTTLGGGNLTNSQGDGTVNFGSFALANAGYVRIYFDGLSNNRNFAIDNVSVLATAPIPEPGTYALFLAGLSAIGFIARRRRPQR